MIQALAQHTNHSHFDTPEAAIKPLAPFLPQDKVIWECTDTYGKSGITSGLRKLGFTVEASGKDQWDFIRDHVEGWDVIVTNPPFNQKDQFIQRCISYGKPWALLLPLTALEGQRRHALWSRIQEGFGLLVLDKRIEFTGGGVWFNTSWFTWGLFQGIRFGRL
jgi:hypothetical protein